MALLRQRVEFFKQIFAEIESDPRPLSEFEIDFMKDQKERFDKYGSSMFVSTKQLAIFIRVGERYKLEEDVSGEE
jgi:hypothetical protein